MSNVLMRNSFLPTNYGIARGINIRKTRTHLVNKMPSLRARETVQMSAGLPTTTASPNTHLEMLSVSEDIQRNFWPNYFLNYIPEDLEKLAKREQQVNELKEDVRKELVETIAQKPILEQLQLIDDIQRLGVGYNFENEIEEALNRIYGTYCQCHDHIDHDLDLDLYHASLMFRLLRQNGIHISCDIFNQFLDGYGKFQALLSGDVDGVLSLYEASHLRTHGDDILDEALTFTTTQLKLMASKLDHPMAEKVAHALDLPLHKGVARIESRHYISFYEHNPCHNKILLEFAKLNFNFLQSLHNKELGDLTRWCFEEGMDVYTKLPCNVRDQIAEIHYSAIGTFDERPEYSLGRITYFKVLLIGTMIDDLFDVCDFDDLQLLSEAIQRWDKSCVSQLPDNMRVIYTKLLDTFEEVEQPLAKEGKSDAFHQAVEAFKIIWPPHIQLRKWRNEKYVPTLEEYLTTKGTTGFKFLTIIGWLGVGKIAAQEAFEWLQQYSKTIDAICSLYRVMDDIAEDYLMEEDTIDELSVISCYMMQHKVRNKAQVYEELHKIVDDVWKDINYAMLQPSTMPMSVLQRFVTQARFVHVGFYKGDGFTFANRTPMKQNFELLYKDTIPI